MILAIAIGATVLLVIYLFYHVDRIGSELSEANLRISNLSNPYKFNIGDLVDVIEWYHGDKKRIERRGMIVSGSCEYHLKNRYRQNKYLVFDSERNESYWIHESHLDPAPSKPKPVTRKRK